MAHGEKIRRPSANSSSFTHIYFIKTIAALSATYYIARIFSYKSFGPYCQSYSYVAVVEYLSTAFLFSNSHVYFNNTLLFLCNASTMVYLSDTCSDSSDSHLTELKSKWASSKLKLFLKNWGCIINGSTVEDFFFLLQRAFCFCNFYFVDQLAEENLVEALSRNFMHFPTAPNCPV